MWFLQFFSYMLQVLMIAISRKVVYRMRKDVFEKLLSLPVGYFDVHQSGDIISRISYDIDTVNVSLSDDVVQLLTTVITVSGAFVMMVLISPRLVLVFAFTLPLSVCITRYLTGKTRPLFRERSAKLGALNGFVEEMVSGQKTLKAYCQEENTIDRFEERNENAMKAYYRAEYYGSIVGPMVNFVNNLSLSLISVFGAVLYLFGQMSIGNISSFVLYPGSFQGQSMRRRISSVICSPPLLLRSGFSGCCAYYPLLPPSYGCPHGVVLSVICLQPGFFKWSKSYVEIL